MVELAVDVAFNEPAIRFEPVFSVVLIPELVKRMVPPPEVERQVPAMAKETSWY